MIIKREAEIRDNEVTDKRIYLGRRTFLKQVLALGLTGSVDAMASANQCLPDKHLSNIGLLKDDKPNTLKEISHYNNYYEFSTSKDAVALLAKDFKTRPWHVVIEGEVEKPMTFSIDDLLARMTIVDRTYRLRCVEGWSMIIPWQGFQLCELLKAVQPTSRARYVEFHALLDKEQYYGQRIPGSLEWPYREVLTIAEATHPLTILATGLYGESLPNQNGAPIRLVVPWKYGYKNIKAITRIRLTEQPAETSWMEASPGEYGFYGNVNPNVSHPRWSQRREVRIGEIRKRKTLMFNGYADQVAQLYSGLDLSKNF